MENKDILIVSVSGGDAEDSLIVKSFLKKLPNQTLNVDKIGYECHGNNRRSLASIYNRYIDEKYKDKIVLFIHDDVHISERFLHEKCNDAIKMYDVFGVAGGAGPIKIEKGKPCLWHLISERKVGFAGHFFEAIEDMEKPHNTQASVTSFGLSPDSATLIDGVFLGINVEKVLEKGVKFDELCPAKFHFYDLLFCVNAKLAGLSLGVFPINIFHQSPGLTQFTEEFKQGDDYFREFCQKK